MRKKPHSVCPETKGRGSYLDIREAEKKDARHENYMKKTCIICILYIREMLTQRNNIRCVRHEEGVGLISSAYRIAIRQSVGKSLFVTPSIRGKDNILRGLKGSWWKLCDLDQSGSGYRPLIDFVKAVITMWRIWEKPSGPPSAVQGELLGGDRRVMRKGTVVGVEVSEHSVYKTFVLFEQKKVTLETERNFVKNKTEIMYNVLQMQQTASCLNI